MNKGKMIVFFSVRIKTKCGLCFKGNKQFTYFLCSNINTSYGGFEGNFTIYFIFCSKEIYVEQFLVFPTWFFTVCKFGRPFFFQ